jgi:hypothetical protein
VKDDSSSEITPMSFASVVERLTNRELPVDPNIDTYADIEEAQEPACIQRIIHNLKTTSDNVVIVGKYLNNQYI